MQYEKYYNKFFDLIANNMWRLRVNEVYFTAVLEAGMQKSNLLSGSAIYPWLYIMYDKALYTCGQKTGQFGQGIIHYPWFDHELSRIKKCKQSFCDQSSCYCRDFYLKVYPLSVVWLCPVLLR